LIPFAAVLVVFFLVMPGSYRHRVTSIWDPHYRTNVQRMELLEGGWNMFKDHPLVGVGSMDMDEMYRRYKPPEAVYIFGHMHNIFLQVAVTTGIVGLIPFCVLLWFFFRLMGRNRRLTLSPPEHAWVVGSIGALIGFLVNGLFEWNFGDAEVITLLYFLVGSNLAISLHGDGFADEPVH
jgi:O-antigen ligase